MDLNHLPRGWRGLLASQRRIANLPCALNLSGILTLALPFVK